MVINDVMAKYYGAPLPASGHRFSRVPAIEGRGGILTQAAFLLGHSDGEDAHAVNRGVWFAVVSSAILREIHPPKCLH